MAYRRDEMWSEERYTCERLPRERLPPRPDVMQYTFGNIKLQEPESALHFQHDGFWMSWNRDDYHRVVSFAAKKPALPERPGEGSYSRYDYSHGPVVYRDYGEGRGFASERRSGPLHRIEDPGYRWSREDHPSRQPDYRDIRDGTRRKPVYPNYARDRSPHKRDSPYFRESSVGRRDSPHSRSGSSVSSRSYSPDRSKAYALHQSQHSRSMSSLHKRNISQQGKERSSSQSLKTSRDVSPSGTTVVPPSKAASTEPCYVEHHEETGTNITENNELFEDSQHVSRSKAIAAKTKEIEQVYRQDCETFGAVVKMLIEKDPSLEKPIQFSLRQNLHEIGERCVEELKHFIAEYDSASQEFEET
ncbi:periphilin-1 isoform X7 [Varanus komodoensis]|uniref:periphilin-1 isoform X7 n=1 Tax=Varanus komodoensis TaxID=61221 RepID=UPI001CF7D613|nr:periphilin-1 isoform X7 [Varanus komodoensis]